MSTQEQKNHIKVLYAAAEAIPFVKTGGLADVSGTLPVILKRAGVDIRVILPKYRDIDGYWKQRMQFIGSFYVNMGWRRQYCGIEYLEYEGVTFYFIDNEYYFARDAIYGEGQEEGERFGFFCRALIESMPYIDFFPDILHCNDWQTGMVPPLLQLHYKHLPDFSRIKTLYTIHNLKYQGVFGWEALNGLFGLSDRYFTPEYLEFYGAISFMKGGIVFANHISTVSPSYALEIQTPYYGERLEGLLYARRDSVTGILNGIDRRIWNPWLDSALPARYSQKNPAGKAACKAALQQEFGLPQDEDAMVIGIVTRLTEQKGLDLIERVLNELLHLPVQLVVMGQGDAHYQEMFTWAQWRYQGKIGARFEYNEALSHRVYAGSDLYLMPSRFEPCGLSQIIALRYGAVPLVRETGGLKDTVRPYNKYTDEGNGFSFANYNAHEMLYVLEQAIKYYQDKKLWARLMQRGMAEDYGWRVSAQKYEALYAGMLREIQPAPSDDPPAPIPPAPVPPVPMPSAPTPSASIAKAASSKSTAAEATKQQAATVPVAPKKAPGNAKPAAKKKPTLS